MQTLFGIPLGILSSMSRLTLAEDSCPYHLYPGYPPVGLSPLPFTALVTGNSSIGLQCPFGTVPTMWKCVWIFPLSVAPGVGLVMYQTPMVSVPSEHKTKSAKFP